MVKAKELWTDMSPDHGGSTSSIVMQTIDPALVQPDAGYDYSRWLGLRKTWLFTRVDNAHVDYLGTFPSPEALEQYATEWHQEYLTKLGPYAVQFRRSEVVWRQVDGYEGRVAPIMQGDSDMGLKLAYRRRLRDFTFYYQAVEVEVK